MMVMAELKFMEEAVALGLQGMHSNEGGPFGCVVVKDGQIIGKGWNKVMANNDPTAHAEVTAIRDACKNINSFQLTGCEVYTTCEPCPMCMGAIYWARPDKVYYANTRKDAAAIGFDDSMIYEELTLPMHERKIIMECLSSKDATDMFESWVAKNNKTLY